MGWVVNATPRPLYPRERPGTHCIGGWVGPRSGLDEWGKFRPHRDSTPDRPARSESLYRLTYLGPRCTVRTLLRQNNNRPSPAKSFFFFRNFEEPLMFSWNEFSYIGLIFKTLSARSLITPNSLLQYFHVTVRAASAVHIGSSAEYVSYIWLSSVRSSLGIISTQM